MIMSTDQVCGTSEIHWSRTKSKRKQLNCKETSSFSLYWCGQFPKFHRCYTKRSVLDTKSRVRMLRTSRVFQNRKPCSYRTAVESVSRFFTWPAVSECLLSMCWWCLYPQPVKSPCFWINGQNNAVIHK